MSLLSVPLLPPMPGLTPALRRAATPHLPKRPQGESERQRFMAIRARQRLLTEIAAEDRTRRGRLVPVARPAGPPAPVVVGAFYAVWQETGVPALRACADHLTHLFPAWLRVGANGDAIDSQDWDPQYSPQNLDVLRICRDHDIVIHPVLANAHEGVFDPERAHRLLADPAHQERVARACRDWLVQRGFRGLNVDLENLTPEDAALVPSFLERLRTAFADDSLALSFDLQAGGNRPPAAEVARWCDFVMLMGYDQHGRRSPAGALCGARWFAQALDSVLIDVPPERLVCGIGAYGYDWTGGQPPATVLTYQQAVSEAADHRPGERPEDAIDFDASELNATFTYRDDDGDEHEVWMLDAASAANQRTLSLDRGVRGAALWVLGSEDPGVWTFLDRARPDARPAAAQLANTAIPAGVDFDGDGELLTVQSEPRPGSRTLDRDAATGLFTDQDYHLYPSPYILHRLGFTPGAIALTFDDGPASPWTPRILDVLAADSVRATFFVIGQNAARHPDLLRRIWDEGHEIGDHTYTHPNLAAVPIEQQRLELTATQRVIEANLGRSTVLFRPPYNADAEPVTADEVQPILHAADLGYTTVGEYLDPEDWNLVTVDSTGEEHPRQASDIVHDVLEEVANGHGNTVLLHDGGGDRSRTVEALRALIPELRRRGYRFVTVSELAGLRRDQVMPPLAAHDRSLRGVDRATFDVLFVVQTFLYWAFLTAIGLGAARVLLITTLALVSAGRRRAPPAGHAPSVSVLIAAYNEAPVIARTVLAALAGPDPPLEVIVVDDGSTDGTAAEIERVAAGNPRVRLVRQSNAGKSAALNRAVALSSGEVLVCLDADTLFAPTTLGLLARHFTDPRVGAVAGNVKVGNRVNLWTIWQSIEYIVSQNLDRRAYDLLNAITVVPGAVGAWRREAVLAVGGYLPDTLAEDTDLTWRLRIAGWRIRNESEALAYTEAPDSLGTLLRQRFRWTYGTLQCLWKHRAAMGHHGCFGRLALPSLWLFQIGYQILSPLIDLLVVWSLLQAAVVYATGVLLTRDWQPLPQTIESLAGVATLFGFFFLLEFLAAVIAYRLDRERPRDLLWVFWQRFVYRQIMYAVALRSIRQAIAGRRAGWGKGQRRGTAQAVRV